MKMKVSSTMKGKLSLPYLYGDFKAGDQVEFTKEQLESLEIQNFISSGLLEFLNDKDKPKAESTYKNLTKTILMFSFGLSVKPLQPFVLPDKYLNSEEVKQFVKEGKIGPAVVVKDKKVANKETNTKKDKTIKRVEGDSSKNKPYIANPNDESSEKEDPKGMYVHNPKRHQNKEDAISQQIQELESRDSDGIGFADIKQAKEKLLKTQKAINKQG